MSGRKYEVVTECHVPVGPGWKWKRPGQVVTLDAADARALGARVVPVGGVQKVNTPAKSVAPVKAKPKIKLAPQSGESLPPTSGKAESDGGESESADERARGEAGQRS